jgi:hypothetical protein
MSFFETFSSRCAVILHQRCCRLDIPIRAHPFRHPEYSTLSSYTLRKLRSHLHRPSSWREFVLRVLSSFEAFSIGGPRTTSPYVPVLYSSSEPGALISAGQRPLHWTSSRGPAPAWRKMRSQHEQPLAQNECLRRLMMAYLLDGRSDRVVTWELLCVCACTRMLVPSDDPFRATDRRWRPGSWRLGGAVRSGSRNWAPVGKHPGAKDRGSRLPSGYYIQRLHTRSRAFIAGE